MISKGMENDTLKTSWKGMKRILFLSSRKKWLQCGIWESLWEDFTTD